MRTIAIPVYRYLSLIQLYSLGPPHATRKQVWLAKSGNKFKLADKSMSECRNLQHGDSTKQDKRVRVRKKLVRDGKEEIQLFIPQEFVFKHF